MLMKNFHVCWCSSSASTVNRLHLARLEILEDLFEEGHVAAQAEGAIRDLPVPVGPRVLTPWVEG